MNLGYKQNEFAEAIGVTKTYVSHVENERSKISTEKLIEIAEKLGCEAELKIIIKKDGKEFIL